ncbi:hypothetical protein LCGC14_2023370 [marine sediment metagenome]|uniref:Uncharacterized protein n=1 Tax=marine sediment metagenome TaxID=412755 RepID=A0A0F9EX09_9ZZZZ
MTAPAADIITFHQNQSAHYDFPLDRLRIRFGHEGEDEIQIRLEDDGDIFLCYDDRCAKFGEHSAWVNVSFDLFKKEWPAFVKHLRAKQYRQENDE